MARRRNRRDAISQTPPDRSRSGHDPFDDAWLAQLRERPHIRFVDLTQIEDRRKYSPEKLSLIGGEAPKTLRGTRARIVIVPEGHRLARLQTYGGRYKIHHVFRQQGYASTRPGWGPKPYDPNAKWEHWTGLAKTYHNVERRIGFAMPWQVIICVRRKRRREVLHAIGKAGRGRRPYKRPRRNFWSEVRC